MRAASAPPLSVSVLHAPSVLSAAAGASATMLRRFCPVPSVRRGEADCLPRGLSDALAVGTRDVHDSSDAFIRVRVYAPTRRGKSLIPGCGTEQDASGVW